MHGTVYECMHASPCQIGAAAACRLIRYRVCMDIVIDVHPKTYTCRSNEPYAVEPMCRKLTWFYYCCCAYRLWLTCMFPSICWTTFKILVYSMHMNFPMYSSMLYILTGAVQQLGCARACRGPACICMCEELVSLGQMCVCKGLPHTSKNTPLARCSY